MPRPTFGRWKAVSTLKRCDLSQAYAGRGGRESRLRQEEPQRTPKAARNPGIQEPLLRRRSPRSPLGFVVREQSAKVHDAESKDYSSGSDGRIGFVVLRESRETPERQHEQPLKSRKYATDNAGYRCRSPTTGPRTTS